MRLFGSQPCGHNGFTIPAGRGVVHQIEVLAAAVGEFHFQLAGNALGDLVVGTKGANGFKIEDGVGILAAAGIRSGVDLVVPKSPPA